MSGQKSAHKQERPAENPGTFNDWLGLPPAHESKNAADCVETPSNAIDQDGQAAAGSAQLFDAEKVERNAVLSDEILSAINTLGGMLPEAGRKQAIEKFKQTALEAFGVTMASPTAEALASVKGGATLLRQWHVYQRLLTTVVLPPDKQLFDTLEEAKAGKNLETTYRRARARQKELGIELVPENDKYIKRVASAATLTYLKLNQVLAA